MLIWINSSIELILFVNLIVFSLVITAVSIGVNLIVVAIRPKIKSNTNFYLYAFSTGLLIIIGTVGLLAEGIKNANEDFNIVLAVTIVTCGSSAGLIFTVTLRYLLSKKFKHKHNQHSLHDHSEHMISVLDTDDPKAAWLVIGLLLAHRSIDGFTLGSWIPKMIEHATKINFGFFIAFFLHIIFEVIFIYYRQIQYGQKKWKAVLYNFYTLLALAFFIFIGGFLYRPVQNTKWILPFSNSFGGVVLTFVSVLEIIPEFIHFRNLDSKKWYITIAWFGAGLLAALSLISLEAMK